jgi:hypothetical protein
MQQIIFKNVNYTSVDLSFTVKRFLKVSKKEGEKRSVSRKETKIVLFLVAWLITAPLQGKMTVGLLVSIESNSKMWLLDTNTPHSCEPFGVITLEKMGLQGINPQECTQAIEGFYKTSPRTRYFARNHLHLQQTYSYERIQEGCVLYGNGPESYSEMLLRNGLAVVDPAFNNAEWNERLKRAQEGARTYQRGIHATSIRKWCIAKEE